MRIVIPTRGRVDKQITLRGLPKELYPQVVIVCPKNEVQWHREHKVAVVAQLDDTWTIARKRQWIIEELCYHDEKIVMLDDDLRFRYRLPDNPMSFPMAKPENIVAGFRELEEHLSAEVPHAGFAAAGMSINPAALLGGWQRAKRMMYVLGYHVPTIHREVILGRIETREDMDVCLQLLKKGFPNEVNYSLLADQIFGKTGGCTKERTLERSDADALKLVELHTPWVKAVRREYKESPARTEVKVQWQKCYEHAVSAHPRG
jgi:hypothetical protein